MAAVARGVFAIGLMAACAATAQQRPVTGLEMVTVTGTRLPPPHGSTAATTRIDAATLSISNKPSVSELLADVPGVHINIPGSRGSVGELIVRGGEPNFTAVLIDGIPANDPTNSRGGSFDFSTLSVNEIERIEVLRGPFSPIYGSDALTGVVNIVTHEPSAEFRNRARIALGSEDYASVALRVSGPTANTGMFAVNAAALRDGRSAAAAGTRSEAISGKLAYLVGRNASLDLHARHSSAELHAFPDSSGGPVLAVLRDQDRRETRDDSLGLRWRSVLSNRTDLNIDAAMFEHRESVRSPGVVGSVTSLPPNTANTDFARQIVTVHASTKVNSQMTTVFGAGFERQQGISDGTLTLDPGFILPTAYVLERDNIAAFSELAYAVTPALALTAAVRRDRPDTAANQTTGRVGLSYALRDGAARLRAGWAQGYKLPSLFALGDPLVGNPDLVPETVTSWETGFDAGRPSGRLGLEFTVFSQRYANLIDFDFEQFRSVNRDRVKTDGLEIGARLRVNDALAVRAHGTWTDINVLGPVRQLRQRPEQRGGASVFWSIAPSVEFYAGWRYVGARLDEAIPTGERTLSSYSRLDLSVSWQLNPLTMLQIAIDNVSDRRYEDAIGFPSLGTRLRLALHTELGPRR